jgi:hypothetical protein
VDVFPHKFPHKRTLIRAYSRQVPKGAGWVQRRLNNIVSVICALSAISSTYWAENLQAGGRRFESCTAHHNSIAPNHRFPHLLVFPPQLLIYQLNRLGFDMWLAAAGNTSTRVDKGFTAK